MTIEKLLKEVENMELKSITETLKEIEKDILNRTEYQKFKSQMIIEEIKHQEFIDNEQFKKEYGYNKLDY